MNDFVDLPFLRCAIGDTIATHSTFRPSETRTDQFPPVQGVVRETMPRGDLVLLEGHGYWCFLRGATMVKKAAKGEP